MKGNKEGLTKTCLRIDEETWKNFKIMCINNGISANEQLNRLVSEFMEKNNKRHK